MAMVVMVDMADMVDMAAMAIHMEAIALDTDMAITADTAIEQRLDEFMQDFYFFSYLMIH